MRTVFMVAGLFAAAVFAPTASAQQFLSQKRTVGAYSETYEPFFDNITYFDTDLTESINTGAFEATATATTSFFTNDFGYGQAYQLSDIDAVGKSLYAYGTATSDAAIRIGADSEAYAESKFELNFAMTTRGPLNLRGFLSVSGLAYDQGATVPPEALRATLVVTRTKRADGTPVNRVVYTKAVDLSTANPQTNIASLSFQDSITLSRGEYNITLVAYSFNSTYPGQYPAVFEAFSEYELEANFINP